MDRRTFLEAAIGAVLAAGTESGVAGEVSCGRDGIAAPLTRKIPEVIHQFDRVRVDDYAWLKAPNWLDVWRDPAVLDPPIRRHLQRENTYADRVLAPTASLQKALLAQMRARSGGDAEPPPIADGPWLYYRRFAPGAEHPAYYRRPRDGSAAEELLLDVALRAAGHDYFAVPTVCHSPDHRWFAWAEDDTGSEKFRLHLKDLQTGEIAAHTIRDAFGQFVFSPDSNWLFWVWRDENSRPRRVFRRPVRGSDDSLVYEETDPGFYLRLSRLRSNAYLKIRLLNGHTSEVRLIPAADPTATPTLVEARTPEMNYDVEHWRDRFVILTDADGAIDYKLMWADVDRPQRRDWREWIPMRRGRCIEAVMAFRDQLVRRERVEANPTVIITQWGSSQGTALPFDEPAYTLELDEQSPYDEQTMRLRYESPRLPPRWYDCDLAAGTRQWVKAATVPGGYDPQRYVVERDYASADDGARIPITVLRLRRTPKDGSAPLLLYGYGSYGFCIEAQFSVPELSLVDRGWVYAIAHIRGGGANGQSWYRQAILGNKKRTFTDFIACADRLIGRRYANRDRVVIYGASAGGLLMGAVTNMRPDLWAGVIAEAPFVDMLNTMSDPRHPLVPLARPDWGDPLADPAAYDWIASISPYENVTRRRYPPILATTSVTDDRVGYWEPAKWIAKIRALSSSATPAMLTVAMSGGHMGPTGRYDALRMKALFWAFADWSIRHPCRRA